MTDLLYRAEDIQLDEILDYYVETPDDRVILDRLKNRSPVLLRGSRGVGKSFLLRVAEAELRKQFSDSRVLPVYVTFARAGLLRQTESGFLPWMISKITTGIKRAATVYGLALPDNSALVALMGMSSNSTVALDEQVQQEFEQFWKNGQPVNRARSIPDSDVLRDAIEDLCDEWGVARIILFVDEAAHVFIPDQQRQFFTLMRDLRSPRLAIKAAVYPGATSYGESFQPTHDATVVNVERSPTDEGYASAMRDIVLKQDQSLRRGIEQYGEAFDVLAYAATGNPRVLLKTLTSSAPFNRNRAQESVRKYYREEIWSEHSTLAERYPGHRDLIDWGRHFIEREVLPTLHKRNQPGSEASSAIWVHRDAPQTVKEALRLLCYSGVLLEGVSGIRATRSEVGTRYMVNLGCNMSVDADPISYGARLRGALSVKRMQEFGANHASFKSIADVSLETLEVDGNVALSARLQAKSGELDLTPFQKSKLEALGLDTIGDVLQATEESFISLHYIGAVRARQMRNAAIIAVIEYLSG
ncbi:hypothetical protein BFL36_13900 [Clavibacter michiganensis]|uniref:Orc1-like AAA ATPase domain-containing protein n=1 Tax=Clavibacter michiganensis TaxID=28447 RepID=A0A251Y4D8_9MICO|nr:hypothetical protein [Clavibacter michiganensis]OUE19131.1 hypothetical protein BFL36_13900 [Clavibacter michiganensis]